MTRNLPCEWGSHQVASSNSEPGDWEWIDFRQPYKDPIVVCFGYYEYPSNAYASIEAEISGVRASGCYLRKGVPGYWGSSSSIVPSSMNVHYFVGENTGTSSEYVLPGTDIPIQVGKFTDTSIDYSVDWSTTETVSLYPAFSDNIAVLASRVTWRNTPQSGNWTSSWACRVLGRTEPPLYSDGNVHIGFNGSRVNTVAEFSTAEIMNYVIIQVGSGSMTYLSGSGINISRTSTKYEVIQGQDAIVGIDNDINGTPELYYMDFSKTPSVCVAHQMSMDGPNGSWAVGHSITPSSIRTYAMEDQATIPERAHINETFGYLIIEDEGYYPRDGPIEFTGAGKMSFHGTGKVMIKDRGW